jgi:hypothetical protein
MAEQFGYPAGLDRPRTLRFPFLGRRVEQVAHHLPPDGRIAFEQPLDDTVFAHAIFYRTTSAHGDGREPAHSANRR